MLKWVFIALLLLNLLGISALLNQAKRITLDREALSILVVLALKEAHDNGAEECGARPIRMMVP